MDRNLSGGSNAARRTLALIVVRNTVTHDARVLREAATLRDLGFDVLIAGVVSPQELQTELRLNDFRVVRLRLLEPLKALLRTRSASARTSGAETDADGQRVRAKTSGLSFHLRRLAVTFAYYVQGVRLVWQASPAVVHANDYNTMWVGVAGKLLRRSRLVYDAHELWPDRNYRREWRPWLLACEWLFVRLADTVVTASPGFAEVIARRYRVEPPLVVRNVPDRAVEAPQRLEGLRAGEQPLAVYVGVVAAGRGIEQAIDALPLVPELRLRLMGPGEGHYVAELEHRAVAADVTERVEIRPPVPPAAVAETIAGADMGLALIQPICLSYELCLPNKLFEYTAAGLPILASNLPVLGPLVRDNVLGETAPPADVAAIARGMQRLADPSRNADVREHVRAFTEHATWQRERLILEQVYIGLPGDGGQPWRGADRVSDGEA